MTTSGQATQLVVVSTFYQCVCVAAAVDSGAIPNAGERILVVADGAIAPELTDPFSARADFAPLAARFDRVIDLGELVYPLRPVQFAPRANDRALWNTVLRRLWQLGDGPVEIYMDALVNSPSVALARIFHDAPLHLHADGLMVYSPSRRAQDVSVGQRIRTLVHLDMVPGVRPQMLREWAPEYRHLDPAALRGVFEEVAQAGASHESGASGAAATSPAAFPGEGTSPGEAGPCGLVLGQYLTRLGLISDAEDLHLHTEMLETVAAAGLRHVIVKPHPAAPPTVAQGLDAVAERLGLTLEIDTSGRLAEIVFLNRRPQLVVSCFSTALVTARQVFGLDAVAVGTKKMQPRLAPYQNSNRLPLVLADACYATGAPSSAHDLQDLVDAVAYCMQPQILDELREPVTAWLAECVRVADPRLTRYFKRRRLGALGLPGGLPQRNRSLARRAASALLPTRVKDRARALIGTLATDRASREPTEIRP